MFLLKRRSYTVASRGGKVDLSEDGMSNEKIEGLKRIERESANQREGKAKAMGEGKQKVGERKLRC